MKHSTQEITIFIEPMGKPRQTQSDRWKQRDCVMRYRAYADKLRAACTTLTLKYPYRVSWTAYFTMPESWSKKKQALLKGEYHQSKPDRDNVDKGILDALFETDQCVAEGLLTKRWDDGRGARIELSISQHL